MWTDPRGPLRTIVEYIPGEFDHPLYIKLDCGHEPNFASHFSYRIGEKHRCFKCGQEKESDVKE